MDNSLFDSYAKQFPIATGIVIIVWVVTRYLVAYLIKKDNEREAFFIKELDKKDAIIKQKDEELKTLNIKLVEVTERFLEVTIKNNELTSKNNELIASLKDLLKETISLKK
jgi:hypothetical protein